MLTTQAQVYRTGFICAFQSANFPAIPKLLCQGVQEAVGRTYPARRPSQPPLQALDELHARLKFRLNLCYIILIPL